MPSNQAVELAKPGARHTRILSVSDEMRMLSGLLVQPLIAAALAFVVFPWLLLDTSGQTLARGLPGDVIGAARSVAIGAGIVAFFVTLIGALPAAIWLAKRRSVTFVEALLWGLVFGDVPMAVGTLLAGSYGVAAFLRGVAFSSVLGSVGAAAFWAIALRRPEERGRRG